jgi:hypothetical protein
MVNVTLDLTEHKLEIFFHCTESTINGEHMKDEEDKKRASGILRKIHGYILDSKVGIGKNKRL